MPFTNIKYPEGFANGDLVIGNKGYYAVNPRAPRERRGKVVAGSSRPLTVRVLWEGCHHDHDVDTRTLSVLAQGRLL